MNLLEESSTKSRHSAVFLVNDLVDMQKAAPAAYKMDVQALIDRANDLVYGLQALSDKLNADPVTGGKT